MGEEGVDVWTEVLSPSLVVVWAWDGMSLMAVPTTLDGAEMTADVTAALSRYMEDKEMNLTIDHLYDQSDFEGSVEDFIEERMRP